MVRDFEIETVIPGKECCRILRDFAKHVAEPAAKTVGGHVSIRTEPGSLAEQAQAMKLTALTHLIIELNHLIDSGTCDDITVEEILERIDDGSVLRFVRYRGGKCIDLSILLGSETYPGFEPLYAQFLQNLVGSHNNGRKWGVTRRGLCLLVAWTNECIQEGTGWSPGLRFTDV